MAGKKQPSVEDHIASIDPARPEARRAVTEVYDSIKSAALICEEVFGCGHAQLVLRVAREIRAGMRPTPRKEEPEA